MRKIEKIFQLLEEQNIKPATFERQNDLGNGYLGKTKDGIGDITDKMLKRIEKNSKNFYDQLMGNDLPGNRPEEQKEDDSRPTMKDMRELMASNRDLAIANRRLSDAHHIIAEEMRTLSRIAQGLPESGPEQIPLTVAERFSDMLELFAVLGVKVGQWKDRKTALAELNKFWLDKEEKRKEVGSEDGQGSSRR